MNDISEQLDSILEVLKNSSEHADTTATMTFNLDTEAGRHAHKCAVHGKDYYDVLWEMQHNFWRKFIKHADYKHDETWDIVEKMQDEFLYLIEEVYLD